MGKNNVFFLIGTIGILATSIFNILLATILTVESNVLSFSILYPVFLVFLLIGAGRMIRRHDRIEDLGQ